MKKTFLLYNEIKILTTALFIVIDNKLGHDVNISEEEYKLLIYMNGFCEFTDAAQAAHDQTMDTIQKKYNY